MSIQPVPTRPTGRRSRAATASLVAPVVVLGLVVAAAWAGDIGDWVAPDRPDRPRQATPPNEGSPPPAVPAADLSAAPAVAFRLPVATVAATLVARQHGELGGELAAVAGFLSVDPRDRECVVLDETAADETFCRRSAILTASPEPILAVNWDENGGAAIRLGMARPHLHPQILPGTALPAELLARPDPRVRELTPVPVVAIGRFDDERALPCHPGRRHCGEEFVLERIAWAAGRLVDSPSVHDPAIAAAEAAQADRSARLISARESDRGEAVLSRILVTAAVLGEIDPPAAASLGASAGAVWYVRSVGRAAPGDDRHEVTWVVLESATGSVLAASPDTAR